MLQPSSFNINAVFDEIVERGRENGVVDHEAFRDLIEEVLYEHETELGELSDDNNVQAKVETLLVRFDEYLDLIK
ncbi:MAG: hypothetical protein WCJ29_05605 [bacterium]